MRTIALLFCLTLATAGTSQQINIIPQPKSLKRPKMAETFSITPATQIVMEGSNMNNAVSFFNDYLQQFYLFKLKVVKNSTSKNVVRLNYERLDNEMPGAYNMTVDGKGIYIAGDNEEGVFYGMQTLIQLLPVPDARLKMRPDKLNIPYVSVEDAPRFAYRGLHLDCGRNFVPVDFIKKYIDYLALHKMNAFHWHLTEDQGWRIEIKKYPKLTRVGAWRNGTIIGRYPGTGNTNKPVGGFYTQEQVKEIVKYAADRYITVIPEIEMPGHGSAAIAAYPELSCFPDVPTKTYYPKNCAWGGDSSGKQVVQTWGVFDDVFCAGKENTFTFLQDVIDEILPLFPSKYIHVGGDECPKANWKKCPACQKRMKENNLKDEHELQSYFIQRMEKYINSKGRTLIGWDEILEGGLAPNASVMSWRGESGGIAAAKQKHEVIMTPTTYVYFDYSQTQNEDSVTIGGFIDLEKVYSYEPIPKELTAGEARYISGIQANVWTEYMTNPRKIEYMIFPRMAALCEVAWSPKEKKSWVDFEKRLQTQFKRYDLWRTNYSKAYFDLKASVIPAADNNGVRWKLESKFKDAKIDYTTGSSSLSINYSQPIKVLKSNHYTARLYSNNRIVTSVGQNFFLNKSTGKKITLSKEASQNYPGDGAFTLVNGVQNEKGRGRSTEFLGFNGTDCEAVIDLGISQSISSVIVHTFHQKGAWIWRPLTVEVFGSADGQSFTTLGLTDDFNEINNGNGTMKVSFNNSPSRFIKIIIKNWGEIPQGEPGAGNKPWLFVDEIEVN